MELLLLKYGYLLVFAGVIFEGEAVLIAGSFLASRGYFNISTVALVALAAGSRSPSDRGETAGGPAESRLGGA